MTILIAGGTNYIGSHTYMELLTVGCDVVVVDNFYDSNKKTLERVEKITGRKVRFYKTGLLDQPAPKEVFNEEEINSIIHLTDLRTVGRSVRRPLEYYRNDITGTLVLYGKIHNHGVKNIVFSPSTTVYGDPAEIPTTEDRLEEEVINPYGRIKDMLEQILTGLHTANPEWSVMLLHYFNSIGTHESGLIKEGPKGIPNNLVPYVAQATVRKLSHLNVSGDDYNMPDGTGVRDYTHAVDLAKGHVRAVQKLQGKEGVGIHNLGTGVNCNMLDVLYTYEKACDRTLRYEIQPCREDDAAICYSDSTKAKRKLGWAARRGIEEMCADSRK